jgi:hypothetical protein
MQDKLARWSTENKERKFDRLLRLITDRTWLAEAARVTLASGGARTAGVDGIDKQRMESDLPAELSRIRNELLAGIYEPLPARRVYIPKASDKKKMRPLGIPSLRDRIVDGNELPEQESAQGSVGVELWHSQAASYYRARRPAVEASGGLEFYRFTDYTATVFQRLDRIVFWKLGHWLGRKYRATLKTLCRQWVRAPEPGRAKTWVLPGPDSRGAFREITLRRLVTSRKGQFKWRLPQGNPYILRDEKPNIFESRYADLILAMSNT